MRSALRADLSWSLLTLGRGFSLLSSRHISTWPPPHQPRYHHLVHDQQCGPGSLRTERCSPSIREFPVHTRPGL